MFAKSSESLGVSYQSLAVNCKRHDDARTDGPSGSGTPKDHKLVGKSWTFEAVISELKHTFCMIHPDLSHCMY